MDWMRRRLFKQFGSSLLLGTLRFHNKRRMKRPHSSTVRKQPVFLDPAFPAYGGYLPPATSASDHDDDDDGASTRGRPRGLDRVDARSITPQAFFEAYVSRRKPCVLFHLIDDDSSLTANDPDCAKGKRTSEEPIATDPTQLLQALHAQLKDASFQMEVRESSQESFGQNRTSPGRQVEMTFGQFLDEVPAQQKHLYYLSTQQSKRSKNLKEDVGGEEVEERYDASGGRLANALEESSSAHPNVARALERAQQLAGSLLLDSKHGWLGFSPVATGDGGEGDVSVPTPSCSGLHHDFHDNFNVQLVGAKVWTLYPPTEYPHIPLFGTVHGIHGFNGLLCYRDNVTRADGVPLSVLLRDDDQDGEEEDEEDSTGAFGNPGREDSDEEDEDGGGEGDEGDSTGDASNRVDDENSNESPKKGLASTAGGDHDNQRRPSSFSPVDMTLSAEDRAKKHPGFCPIHEITVEVRAGEALYLPASWFHSVSSSAADVGSETTDAVSSAASTAPHPPYHLAVNYWYHPPDQDNFQQPYRNDYWAKHVKTKSRKQ
jgi:Cupin-like domain